MKFINVIFILIGFFLLPVNAYGKFGLSEMDKNKLYKGTLEICRDITKVPKHMTDEFHAKGKMFEDPAFKCYAACLFDVTGQISENKINVVKVLEGLNKTNSDVELKNYWKEIIPKCSEVIDKSDVCETVFSFLKCIKLHKEL